MGTRTFRANFWKYSKNTLFIGLEILSPLTCALLEPGIFIFRRTYYFICFLPEQMDRFRWTGRCTKTTANASFPDNTIGFFFLFDGTNLAAIVHSDAADLARSRINFSVIIRIDHIGKAHVY